MKKINTTSALLAAAALAGLLGGPVRAEETKDTATSTSTETKETVKTEKAGKTSGKKGSGKHTCKAAESCKGKGGCKAK